MRNGRGFAASREQRVKVRDQFCAVSLNCSGQVQPAHLIDRSLTGVGQDDARAVVPLCARHHRAFDEEGLDLSPYLEPRFRVECAYAVERVGLWRALRRITNQRQS